MEENLVQGADLFSTIRCTNGALPLWLFGETWSDDEGSAAIDLQVVSIYSSHTPRGDESTVRHWNLCFGQRGLTWDWSLLALL